MQEVHKPEGGPSPETDPAPWFQAAQPPGLCANTFLLLSRSIGFC